MKKLETGLSGCTLELIDSNIVHGGHTSTDQKTRVLINFNYEI